MTLFDQVSRQSVVRLIITIIVLAGVIAALWVILGVLGISIPSWAATLFWIVVVVVIGVFVVRFLASLW